MITTLPPGTELPEHTHTLTHTHLTTTTTPSLDRRLRHCGGRDGSTGATGPSPDKVGAGRSGTHCIRLGGCRRRMPIHDSATGDREGREGEGAMATGGEDLRGAGGRGQGDGDAIVGGAGVV